MSRNKCNRKRTLIPSYAFMSEKNKKLIKVLILIFSITLPISMFLGLFVPISKANEYVPEKHVNNKWHWNITGDEPPLIYEFEFTIKSIENPTEVMALKGINIYGITGFQNITMDFMGSGQQMSQVNATMFYYDPSIKNLRSIGPEFPIAIFGYNSTVSSNKERFLAGETMFVPFLLPINDTTVNAQLMKNILNNTYFGPAASNGFVNYFDYCGAKDETNNHSIWLKDTSNEWYLNLSYYDNGTLRYSKGKVLFSKDSPTLDTIIEFEFKRVFDWNVTDEIDWGVKEGETYYFGGAFEDGFNETKVVITGFNTTYFPVPFLFGGEDNPIIPLAFEEVLANISLWDFQTEEWTPPQENFTIGLANNFNPMYVQGIFGEGEEEVPQGFLLVIPNNTKKEDLSFYFNNDTCQSLYGNPEDEEEEGGGVHFDVAYVEDGYVELKSYYRLERFLLIFDQKTGVIKVNEWKFLPHDGGPGWMVFFRKNMTIVSGGITNNIPLYSDLVGTNTVYSNTTFPSNDREFYWAVLPVNPIGNHPIPYEIPDLPLYIDIFLNNSDDIIYNKINFTIIYDQTKLGNIPESDLGIYYYDFYEEAWKWHPNCTLDEASNKIVLNLTQTMYYALGSKSMTNLVKWSVEPGDEFYVGMYDSDHGYTERYRAIIKEINITTVNMYDIDSVVLPGQPIVQNFSTIYAHMSQWDRENLVWDDEEVLCIAASNNYWSMAPFFSPSMKLTQLILPNGTTGQDLRLLLFWDPGGGYPWSEEFSYEEKTFGTNYVDFNHQVNWDHTSIDIWFRMNFTVENGHINYMRGYIPYIDEFRSFWELNATQLLNSPVNDFLIDSPLVSDWKISANISWDTGDLELYSAVFPDIPTFDFEFVNRLPENISLFFDLDTNYTGVGEISANITIDYKDVVLPPEISRDDLTLYMYDEENEFWDIVPNNMITRKATNITVYLSSASTLFAVGTDMLSNVEWCFEEDEIMYYGDENNEYRACIIEINESKIVNMTQLLGIDLKEKGYPDNQTFSLVWADIYHWDDDLLQWIFDKCSLVGTANNYWPIAPGQFYESLGYVFNPLLMPMETQSVDLELFFNVTMEILQFNAVETGVNYCKVYNKTNNYASNLYFDNITGVIRHVYGYGYNNGEWHQFSQFSKFNTTITLSDNPIILDNTLLGINFGSTVAFEISNPLKFYYAMLAANPTSKNLPWGTPLVFFDMMVVNTTMDQYNMTWIVDFPSNYDLHYIQYFNWNPIAEQWVYTSLTDNLPYVDITFDYNAHRIICSFYYMDDSFAGIGGFSYNPPSGYIFPAGGDDDDDGGEKAPAAIPGFDLWIILGLVAMISLITILKRKKLIELV